MGPFIITYMHGLDYRVLSQWRQYLICLENLPSWIAALHVLMQVNGLNAVNSVCLLFIIAAH
jgi:hypothetical protein